MDIRRVADRGQLGEDGRADRHGHLLAQHRGPRGGPAGRGGRPAAGGVVCHGQHLTARRDGTVAFRRSARSTVTNDDETVPFRRLVRHGRALLSAAEDRCPSVPPGGRPMPVASPSRTGHPTRRRVSRAPVPPTPASPRSPPRTASASAAPGRPCPRTSGSCGRGATSSPPRHRPAGRAVQPGARLGQLWQVHDPAAERGGLLPDLRCRCSAPATASPTTSRSCVTGVFVFTFTQSARSWRHPGDHRQPRPGPRPALPPGRLPLSFTLRSSSSCCSRWPRWSVILLAFGVPVTASLAARRPRPGAAVRLQRGPGPGAGQDRRRTTDFAQLMPFLLRTWMYLSGIF